MIFQTKGNPPLNQPSAVKIVAELKEKLTANRAERKSKTENKQKSPKKPPEVGPLKQSHQSQ